MAKQYLQTQDIFNKVFQNQTGALRLNAYNSTQDYLNAVFDSAKDALRVKIDGVMLPVVGDVTELPDFADVNSICPVTPGDGYIYFYQWNGEEWIPLGGSGGGGGTVLPPEQQAALQWITDNLSRLQELASSDYLVQVEDIILTPANSQPVVLNIQGEFQDIDDDGNLDGDSATHYRIDVTGYVLGIETYPDENAVSTDRYYTKIVYEPQGASQGISHLYLTVEEYEWFSSFTNGKNILRIAYVKNVFPGIVTVREAALTFPEAGGQPVNIDVQGNVQDIDDDGNLDGDETTHYRIDIAGYVMDVEGFESADSPQATRFLVKMSYDNENNVTHIYFTKEEYSLISSFPEGKNTVEVYYLSQE